MTTYRTPICAISNATPRESHVIKEPPLNFQGARGGLPVREDAKQNLGISLALTKRTSMRVAVNNVVGVSDEN